MNMKPLPALRLRLALALAIGLALAAPAGAQSLNVVTENTSYSFLQNGRVAGMATDVVEQTLQRAGITDYHIDIYPWARAQDIALREPYVLIYLIARTPERETRYRWVGEIRRIRYYLYALPNRTDLNLHQLADARDYALGVVRGDVRQQALQQMGFSRLVVSAQPAENLRKLIYRQIDLIALSDVEAASLCNETHPECPGLAQVLPLDEKPTGLYMAYSLATPEAFAARTQAAFDTLRADGTLARILASPAAVAPPPPSATPRRAGN